MRVRCLGAVPGTRFEEGLIFADRRWGATRTETCSRGMARRGARGLALVGAGVSAWAWPEVMTPFPKQAQQS